MKLAEFTKPFIEQTLEFERCQYGSENKYGLSIYLPSYFPLVTYEKVLDLMMAVDTCRKLLFPSIAAEDVTVYVDKSIYQELLQKLSPACGVQISLGKQQTILGFNVEVTEE